MPEQFVICQFCQASLHDQTRVFYPPPTPEKPGEKSWYDRLCKYEPLFGWTLILGSGWDVAENLLLKTGSSGAAVAILGIVLEIGGALLQFSLALALMAKVKILPNFIMLWIALCLVGKFYGAQYWLSLAQKHSLGYLSFAIAAVETFILGYFLYAQTVRESE